MNVHLIQSISDWSKVFVNNKTSHQFIVFGTQHSFIWYHIKIRCKRIICNALPFCYYDFNRLNIWEAIFVLKYHLNLLIVRQCNRSCLDHWSNGICESSCNKRNCDKSSNNHFLNAYVISKIRHFRQINFEPSMNRSIYIYRMSLTLRPWYVFWISYEGWSYMYIELYRKMHRYVIISLMARPTGNMQDFL